MITRVLVGMAAAALVALGTGAATSATASGGSPSNWHWVNGVVHDTHVTAGGWLDKPREHDM